jgi:small-conductance mechanosensitive channel
MKIRGYAAYVAIENATGKAASNLPISVGAIKWISVAVGFALLLTLTPIVARKVTKSLSKPGRSERHKSLAAPAGKFVSTLLITFGLIVAIGVLSPDSLKPFPTKIVEFAPHLLIAILLLLIGSTISTIAANVVGLAVLKSTGKPQPALARLTKTIVMLFIGLLAVGQLGVNTQVLDTLTQAVVYCSVAMVALLGVFGGRDLASHVSSGRYLRRILRPGDHLEANGPHGSYVANGTIKALHAATVELHLDDQTTLHIPNQLLLQAPIKVRTNNADLGSGDAS